MPKLKNNHIVFQDREFRFRDYQTQRYFTIRAGIYIDLDRLGELVLQASRNKSRKSHDGALVAEFHTRRDENV